MQLHVKLAALECIEEPAQLVLSCEGMLLAHDSLVSTLGSAELDLTVPLLGGKVHGSLAHAGNVGPNAEGREEGKEKEDRPCQAPHPVQPQLCQRGAGLRSRGPNANST
ncbi:hypothetical protein pipiens_006504 [Culex pipiens pipiens]|uniref:40S ribosomal protein S30 n=1 Tax=Culex pipiens pipiens TaxID=38569 RepID=A0ABD1DPN9_CULPP